MRSIAPPFDRLVGTRLPRRTTPKPCRRLANEVERQPARAVRELPHVHLASHPGIPAGAADDRIDVRAVRRAVDRDRAAVPQEERAVARLRVDAQLHWTLSRPTTRVLVLFQTRSSNMKVSPGDSPAAPTSTKASRSGVVYTTSLCAPAGGA